MRMRPGPGKSWPRRAAPRSGCSLVPAQIRMLDCCSHMSFHLWPLRSTARCHDNGPYHFSKARCHGNGPDCTILHAILRSKCIRDVTEHVGIVHHYCLHLSRRKRNTIALWAHLDSLCLRVVRSFPFANLANRIATPIMLKLITEKSLTELPEPFEATAKHQDKNRKLSFATLWYCNRRNFRTRFNFVYFVLLAESTKFSSIWKPCTYTSAWDTTVAVRKFVAYESWGTLEYEIFTPTKISTITVIIIRIFNWTRETDGGQKKTVKSIWKLGVVWD